MKRYFSLTLALLMGICGFGFSEKPVESREALLSAQPIVAEFTAAAAPAPEITIKAVTLTQTVTEFTTEPATELTTKLVPEASTVPETEQVTEETSTKAQTETKKSSKISDFAWPADIKAEIIASFPSYSDGSAHWGVDIGLYEDDRNVSEGTAILAARDGIVVTVYNDGKWNTGYGNHCIIDHGDGVQTLYAHSKDIRVKEGDSVVQGQPIGIVGDTGNTTAPHLHFEVRVDSGRNGYKRVNPMKFISEP